MKRITRTTIKSFIRKNSADLHIKIRARFDGMIDGLDWKKGAQFVKAETPVELFHPEKYEHTLGVKGAWFTGRDFYVPIEEEGFKGFEVSNSCGVFTLAVPAR